MSLQVCHLLPQSLNVYINGINSKLNLLHKEGLGNLTKMVQNELYSKAYTNKLLYRNPPPQDPLGRNGINEVVLDVVHHTPQKLQKVLSSGTAKMESLYEVPTATVNYLQVRNTIPRDFDAMEVNKGRLKTLEVCEIEVINLGLVETSE